MLVCAQFKDYDMLLKWTLTEILAAVLVIVFFIYYYRKRYYSYWNTKSVPCERPVPVFGNILDIIISRLPVSQYLAKLYKKYKNEPYFGIYLMDRPALVLRDPEIIKDILIKNFNKFPNRSFSIDKEADPLTCNSIFTVKNPEWKALRTKLSPIFTSGKMKLMLPLMKDCCISLQKHLEENLSKTLEIKEVCGKYTTDVISSCTFGINTNCFVDENSAFRVIGRQLFNTSLLRKISVFSYFLAPVFVKLFKFSFLDREATLYLHNLFMHTLNEREKGKIQRNDLIDILINLKNEKDESCINFDGVTISSQAVTFFSAGHETTSSTMSFALYELAVNEDVQRRLRSEIRTVSSKHGGITYEAIKEMTYLDMVFSETLRKYTQAPFLIRQCVEDCIIPEFNLKIDKGTDMIVPITGLHLDEKYFADPQRFDPERFSEANRHQMLQYTYMPFGNGPRNCIGERFAQLSGKIGLIYVIKDFEVYLTPETNVPLEFNHKSLLLEPKGGIPLRLERSHFE